MFAMRRFPGETSAAERAIRRSVRIGGLYGRRRAGGLRRLLVLTVTGAGAGRPPGTRAPARVPRRSGRTPSRATADAPAPARIDGPRRGSESRRARVSSRRAPTREGGHDGFRGGTAAVPQGRAGAGHEPGDARVSLREAPQGLHGEAQEPDRGQARSGREPRRHPAHELGCGVQQCSSGVEPHLLLGEHEAERRRPSALGRRGRPHRGARRLGEVPQRLHRSRRRALRFGVCVARARRRQGQDRRHAERGEPAHDGLGAAPYVRCVGARLLPRS
jgi:hypothetical protein